jgi:ABC-type spermidine/putrescine transport system permease subunit II
MNTLRKNILVYLLCAFVAFAPGCAHLTPQQKASAQEALANELDAGRITQAQYDIAIESLEETSVDWESLLVAGGSVVASILLGVPIAVGRVNKVRGKPTPK